MEAPKEDAVHLERNNLRTLPRVCAFLSELNSTLESDWVGFGGKVYLQEKEAEAVEYAAPSRLL